MMYLSLSLKNHFKRTILLATPLIGGNFANFAIGMVDTIMMGWYSVPALAALVLGSSFYFVLFIAAGGYAMAVQPLVATASGTNDIVIIRRVTRMGLWLSAITGAIFIPAFFYADIIFTFLDQPSDVVVLAQQYTALIGFALIPNLWAFVFKNYLSALEITRVPLLINIAAALLNIPLNYALIFGNWGIPEMGVQGAAIASVVVNVFMMLATVSYAVYKMPEHELFKRFWRSDWVIFRKVARMGIPIGTATLAEVLMFSFSAIMMGWLGTVELAAHGIVLQITSATFMLHLGLSSAVTIRAGNAWGRRDFDHLIQGAKASLILSLAVSGITMILLIFAGEWLVSLYVDASDPLHDQIITLGAVLIIAAAGFQVADGGQVYVVGLLRGLHDTTIPMLMSVFSYLFIGLPMGYFIAFELSVGALGIWLGLAIGLLVGAIMFSFRFKLLLSKSQAQYNHTLVNS